MKIFGYKLRVEIILSLLFFTIPIILPLLTNTIEPSISRYHYSSQKYTYMFLLSILGMLTIVDGLIYKTRRYNIIIGLSLFGVVLTPVNEYGMFHNISAITFFIGNAYILTYHSKLLSKLKKKIFLILILFTVTLLFLGVLSIFFAEAIGMFTMSYFMFIRFSMIELKRKTFV